MPDAMNRSAGRFLLWVDAVGAYWVCLGDEVTLGQPVRGGAVDVPILGDISNRHARICRDGEGYWIEPLRDVRVDGHLLRAPAPLVDGSRVELGRAVRLVFRRPHPLSATARLDFDSTHRTTPSTDAVLLMAGNCVLGPHAHAHVLCRHWTREVVLFRQEEELWCRAEGGLEIDGHAFAQRGPVHPNARIVGEGFSMSLEDVRG